MNVQQSDTTFLRDFLSGITISRDYLLPSDYSEETRYLPKELTPFPGYYDYNRTPYLKEIVNNFSPLSPIREVALMKPAQWGATTGILEAIIAYFMGSCPRPQLYISADKELVTKGMEVKVDRLIDNSGLRELIKPQTAVKTRKTGDTKTEKDYPGGFLHAIGARVGAKLRSMSYPVLLFDEVDGMPDTIKGEGETLGIALNRTLIPYEDTAKILYLSTPTILQTSKIYKLYMKGDQRQYFVPCINCGEMIVLFWHLNETQTKTGLRAGIIFETLESGKLIMESVRYKCQNCGKEMENHHKAVFLPEGEWRPTAEAQKDRFRSYQGNALYSPVGMFSWQGMVEAWLECWDIHRDRIKDIDKYREFRNTKQGLPFEERGEAPRYERIIMHRRQYAANQILNKQAVEETGSPILFMNCSVDVHNNNLRVDIKGFCEGGRNYTIDYREIEGDTSNVNHEPWKKLEDIIENETWTADDGKLYRIRVTMIDAGHYPDVVYQFCSQYSSGVFPILGRDWLKDGVTFSEASRKTIDKAGTLVLHINTNKIKDKIAQSFRLDWNTGEMQPEWYCNFPETLRDDYFKEFEAEYKAEKRDKTTGQFKGIFWVAEYGKDNHAFDNFVYILAGLEFVAETICMDKEDGLGLDALNWSEFWNYAKTGIYYSEVKKDDNAKCKS